MPSSSKHGKGNSQEQQDAAVPHNIMLQQAGAAVSGNEDGSAATPGERHAGRDVPLNHQETEDFAKDPPLPSYGEIFGSIEGEEQGLGTKATMADDGRVNIRIDQKSRTLSSLMVPALRHQIEVTQQEAPPAAPYIPPSLGGDAKTAPPPPMNLVIHVVGSRGDVQPFISLGKVLKDTYGHRVRLATHPNFKDFVLDNGLEFFSIGGDPAKLMAFMVKNPGLMPGFDTLRNGDVGQRRQEINEMVRGCWRSCFETGDGLGPAVTDDTIEDWASASQPDHTASDLASKPFVADAIIANPPSFAHIHCAEKLGIPLHMMFTMPYSPTQAFPHPLANIQSSNADPHVANYMSYALVDMMTWQGLGDIINRFRTKSLGLDPVPLMWAPGMLQRLKVPHTYCWSPALIPKPKDWAAHISISGFFFLNLASNFTPELDLQAFLDAGPPPVYIGFGSIVLDDPNGMTKMIFEAVQKTGQRALVSKGWGGVGADELGIPEGVFMLGNVPHDWLFKHVSCVVHHGGAGTTAAGITAGRPTLVVPFFGDQQFWGSMVSRAGAGPDPIPHKQLTADNLAEGIMTCLKPESLSKANELAQKIAKERGSDVGAQCFHQHLDIDKLRCTLAPSRMAVWRLKRTQVRLSALAACTLANEGLLDFNDLKLSRGREYETDEGPYEPISGAAGAIIGTMGSMMMGVADFPVETLKALKIHPDAQKKKPQQEAESSDTSTIASTGTPSASDDKALSSAGASTMSEKGSAVTTPSASRTNSSFNVGESLAKIKTPPTPGSSQLPRQNTSSSMTDALQGRLGGRSNSRSKSRSRSRGGSEDRNKPQSGGSGGSNPIHTAMGTGKGVNRIVGAGLKSPMDFTMGLAKGFHNAPKLYGDDTVRKPTQVTDFQSGVRAGWKELGLGFYDGISGLVTQPMRGAQKEGAAGFIKGIGKGIGGVALKPGAAIFGLPAYHMKGVYKELQSVFGSSVNNYIIAARTAQGYDDWQRSSAEERADVVSRWRELNKDLKKKKNPDEYLLGVLREQHDKGCHWVTGHLPHRSSFSSLRHTNSGRTLPPPPPRAGTNISQPTIDNASDTDFERAIQMSVQETSRGNPEEDAAIERAIRASMNELRSDRQQSANPSQQQDEHEQEDTDDEEALRRAMAASVAESQRQTDSNINDEDLERALKASMAEQEQPQAHPPPTYEDAGGQGSSSNPMAGSHVAGPTREEFEQEGGGGGGGEKTAAEKTEEQVVLEYVKKQSLLEQQHAEGKGRGEGGQ